MKKVKYIACMAAAVVACTLSATAIVASYPDQTGTSVWITDISEDTDVGAYGAPTMIGNTMAFSPLGVRAESAGGGSFQNVAQVQFKLEAMEGMYLEELILTELGDFDFGNDGSGTDNTKVDVDANYFLTITEINHNPLELSLPIIPFPTTMSFTPNADGEVVLSEAGLGPFWQGSLSIDLNQTLLDYGYDSSDRATKVNVNINNVLTADSELGTSSMIEKKVVANSFTIEIIPEPGSALLLVSGFAGIAIVRRRFRKS